MFNEITLLVNEGDAAGLAAKVAQLSAVRAELSESVSGGRRGADAPAALVDSQNS